jgi:histidine triad (HIT) family protein
MPEQPQQRQPSPEEMEALKEKIKNMSPEELKEFQKKQCIFCQIIEGKMQAKKVYDDEKSIGILDINPANPGHILLLPKEHYSVMPQMPEEEVVHLFMVAKFLSNTVLKALEATGTNIVVANGPAAGQRAQHFMIHVIPRKEGDGINFELPQKKHADGDLEKVAESIREKLAALMKLKKEQLIKGKGEKPALPLPVQKEVKEEAKEEPEAKEPKEKMVEAVVKEEPQEEKKPKKPKKRKKKQEVPTTEVKVIVEAPKDGEVEVIQKPAKKKKKTKKKKEEKEPEEKKEEQKEEKPPEKEEKKPKDDQVDLDDIARVLGM